MLNAAATVFLLLVGLAFLQNLANGTARQWAAAKFLNRGAPPVPRSGGATSGRIGGPAGAGDILTRPPGSATGSTPFLDPVPGGKFLSQFGAPRDGGARKHAGVDLAAPRGAPVVATADGTVVRVGDAGRCGKRVAIDVGGGTEAIYCHLSGYAVRVGQTVRRGQTVGYVGNTGNAATTGPHLHFELRRNGTPVNPAPLIGR